MRQIARSSAMGSGRFASMIAAVMRSSMDVGGATGAQIDWMIRGPARPRAGRVRVRWPRGWCGAVFDGERECAARAAQVQVRVAPGMELGGAAQRLAGAHASGGFAGVMHEEHGKLVLSLQRA